MKLHIPAVIIDNQLVNIRDNLLYLVHRQQKSVGRKENKAVGELFSAILMEFYNPSIQKRLIVSIQSQMSLISPVPKLVNNAIKQIIFHPLIRALLRIPVCRAEGAGAVAPVDRLKIHHQRHRHFIILQKIIYIFFLQFISGQKLKL